MAVALEESKGAVCPSSAQVAKQQASNRAALPETKKVKYPRHFFDGVVGHHCFT